MNKKEIEHPLKQYVGAYKKEISELTNFQKAMLLDEMMKGYNMMDVINKYVKVKKSINHESSFEGWFLEYVTNTKIFDIKFLRKEYETSKGLGNGATWEASTLKEYTSSNIPPSYEEFFTDMIEDGCFDKISDAIQKEISSGKVIFPPLNEIYTAFNMCPIEKMKVIIIGQDPYHTQGAAMGVAFGHHPDNNKIQPSLKNIYKLLNNDGFSFNPKSGDLTKWCEQGVFLINTALTVRDGEPGSHAEVGIKKGMWSDFIEQLFRYLAKKIDHLVVIMWGSKAQKYSNLFETRKNKHFLLKSSHPSPLNRGIQEFLESGHFKKANKQLKMWNKNSIEWNL